MPARSSAPSRGACSGRFGAGFAARRSFGAARLARSEPMATAYDGLSERHNGPVLSPAVDNLVAQLTRLPGIGQRTAQRLAFHLLRVPKDEALALAAAIEEVKERIRFCSECGNLTEDETCEICRDARRDRAIVCVVEQ